jgi:ATP-dependent Lhr-like helicase
MTAARQTKIALAHTWPVFFARHGSFTPIQTQAVPLLLEGRNALIIAPTASGKTEAVIAPLLERHALGPVHGG